MERVGAELFSQSAQPHDCRMSNGVRCAGRTNNDYAIFIANGTSNFVINNVTVDGSMALGIQTFGARDGRITANRVMNTKAGGIHVTNGAYNVYIAGNTTDTVADDQFGVACGPQENNANCHNILIENNYGIRGTYGRGLLVHGGTDITIRNNKIIKASASGIMIASETTDAGGYPVNNIIVQNNTIDQSPSYQRSSYGGSVREIVQGGPVSNVQYTNNKITNSGNTPFSIAANTTNNYCIGNTYNGAPTNLANCHQGTGPITGAGVTANILGGTTVPFPSN